MTITKPIKDWNKSIAEFLINVKKNKGKFLKVVLLDVKRIEIKYSKTKGSGEFELKFTHDKGGKLSIKSPEFISIVKNTNKIYHIKLDEDYDNELNYLLTDCGNNIEGASPNSFVDCFIQSYKSFCKIFGGVEPISKDDQKGILGELFTLVELYDKYKSELITSWSRDNLIDFDMSAANNINIEAKCTSKSKDALIHVSHYNQLESFNDNPAVILSVVRATSSYSKGDFLYKIIEDKIAEIKKKSSKDSNLLRKKIDSITSCDLFSKDIRKKFVTKFEYHSIEYFEIKDKDSADDMAKQVNLPTGVIIDKYKLKPTVLAKYVFKP